MMKMIWSFCIGLTGFFFLHNAWATPLFVEDFSTGTGKGALENIEIKDGKAGLKICNLINNGSFEVSDKGEIPGFYLYDGTKGALDTATTHDGKNSVLIVKPTGLYLHPTNSAAVREGVGKYLVSVWVKTGFGPTPDENAVQMRAVGFDAEKKTRTQVIGAYLAGTHDWTRLVQPVVPDKNTAFIGFDIKPRIKNPEETGCRLWIDGVQIEEGKRPSAFTEKYYREGLYTSLEIPLAAGSGQIALKTVIPTGTGVEARWRAAKDTAGLETATWSEWNAANPIAFTAKNMKILQLQVRLLSMDRGLETPLISSIVVE